MLAAVFLLLASVAIAGGIVARKQRQEAVRQRTLAQQKTKEAESESRRSEAGRLLAEANSALRDRPQLGLLLMVEAMNVNLRTAQPPLIMTEQALWNTLNVVGGLSLPTRGRGLRCAAISPNGHWLAAGDWDAGVRLWNLETSNVLAGVRILNAHSNGVSALTMSPDSRWLASGYCDGNVVLWDLQVTDSSASSRILRGHTAWINALAMCPDGHWLATASDDTSVRLWDLTRMGDSSRSLVLGVQGSPVTALAMSPDGKWLAAGAEDGNAALWNLSNVQEAASTARILSGHTNRVNAVEISSDSRWLVTGSKDGTARIWDLQEITISNNAKVLAEHVRAVNVVKISPDCRWVATGGFDGSVRLWDLQAKDIKKSVVTLQAHAGGVVISTKVPDKNVPQIHVLHQVLKSGELKKRFEAAKQYNIEPDRLFSSGWNSARPVRNLRVNSIGNAGGTTVFADVDAGGTTALAISEDSRWMFTGGSDGIMNRYELGAKDISSSKLSLRGHDAYISAIVLGLQDSQLVSASWDGSIHLWFPPRKRGFRVIRNLSGQFVWTPDFGTGPLSQQLTLIKDIDERIGQHGWPKSSTLGAEQTRLANDLTRIARGYCGRNLTREEWRQFLPNQMYRKTFDDLPAPVDEY